LADCTLLGSNAASCYVGIPDHSLSAEEGDIAAKLSLVTSTLLPPGEYRPVFARAILSCFELLWRLLLLPGVLGDTKFQRASLQ